MKTLLTLLVATAFLWHLTDYLIRVERPAEPYHPTVVIATDSVEFERLSLGGGTEETVTYTYVSAPAYDSLYKKIFLDTAEAVEYQQSSQSKIQIKHGTPRRPTI